MADIPGGFDDVTPEWFNGHVDLGSPVESIDIVQIGEGYGLISLIGRATVSCADGQTRTVVVKLPSPVPDLVGLAQMYGFYDREVSFYREASHLLPNVATCHHAEIDDSGASFVIVMDDLAHLRMADQVAGCTPDDARMAIDTVAALHTRFWENDALAGLTWLPPANNERYRQAEAQYNEFFAPFVERYGDVLSPSAMRVAEDLRTKILVLQDLAADESPQTLAHFDLRLDNLLFAPDEVYLLDWQLSIRAIGATDVAYFLGWSMTDEQRRDMTDELIGRYHDRVVEQGITGYSRAQFEDHVRRSMLGVAMIAAYGSVAVPAANERGQALLDAMVARVFSAVDDLNSGEFLVGL